MLQSQESFDQVEPSSTLTLPITEPLHFLEAWDTVPYPLLVHLQDKALSEVQLALG